MSYVPEDLPLRLTFEAGARAGENRAPSALEQQITELFERYRVNLLRYLCCLGLPVHDSEEIVQEVFLLLFQHLRREKSRENLRGWLFRVAHNLGLKRRAAIQRQNQFSVTGKMFPDGCAAPEASPEQQILFRQRQQHLLAVVQALSPQDRYCLYLRSEGLQYREIAEILSISLGGVAKSLSRTLQRLANSERRWNHESES